ncbi:exopolyphosphatase [Arenimonas fontis]|uniref:Exopolyphosphatase n=1 Tax=Arenimonas fontis TaxID=2608255 RepID=A0A5B2ZBT6_9GAMM|nr:exopolyphosphatase [Arenimonas fontis]KAA2285586.1 exopolyphosphatase [Arenimonas fontis]
MPARALPPLEDGELLAAVDLGSNSFHMVVARHVLGQLRIVDRIKETVRLAEGLDGRGGLDPAVMPRALDCLARFGQRIASIPPHRVRAIATNTVRQLANPQAFLLPAETALGHGIDVVAGREEARLIYLGVAHGKQLPPGKRRLVIDIGGGSTEFIVGQGFEPIERESLQMGCIASTRRFFPDGKLSRKRWKEARTEITAEFQQFAQLFRARGWDEAMGSSGTIKSVCDISIALKLTKASITAESLAEIRERVLEFDRVAEVKLPGLSGDRRPILAGGLLVLDAAFAELGIERMYVSDYALREGVLYDLLGRSRDEDPREASIQALCDRYGVNLEQAGRVEATALRLFDQVQADWKLEPDERRLLGWAARIHEIGLAVAHSQYHVHGAYLAEHSDIAGFSRTEQQWLAALLRNQRRSLYLAAFDRLPDRLMANAVNCALLLRLAVLLHRSHHREPLPVVELDIGEGQMVLRLSRRWLDAHPLTRADLDTEREHLQDIGRRLSIRAV